MPLTWKTEFPDKQWYGVGAGFGIHIKHTGGEQPYLMDFGGPFRLTTRLGAKSLEEAKLECLEAVKSRCWDVLAKIAEIE